MAATKLKVEYADGRVVEVIASPKAQVETERRFKTTDQAQAQMIESSFFLAWASLHYAGKEPADFEAWLSLVADVDQVQKTMKDEADTDPTQVTQSSTGSSD
ncbi:hypothetical protein [Kribbella sp. NPDC050470]|uniref:hypothetical protein n=1 Tax=unclassified Kribbella TaxID=2644121 RepID=UPI0037944C31